MSSREPVLYELYTSPVTEFTWTAYDAYLLRELAYRAAESLTGQGYRVKVDVTYPSGISIYRVFEGAQRVRVTVTPSPTPAPSPTPSPSPPPAANPPELDFSKAANTMYKILF